MIKTAVILMIVIVGGATHEIKGETYPSMKACEAAKKEVAQQYEREHPDAKVQKVECNPS